MSSDTYTPNTDQVRRYWQYGANAWADGVAHDDDRQADGSSNGAEFDRWLKQVKAENVLLLKVTEAANEFTRSQYDVSAESYKRRAAAAEALESAATLARDGSSDLEPANDDQPAPQWPCGKCEGMDVPEHHRSCHKRATTPALWHCTPLDDPTGPAFCGYDGPQPPAETPADARTYGVCKLCHSRAMAATRQETRDAAEGTLRQLLNTAEHDLAKNIRTGERYDASKYAGQVYAYTRAIDVAAKANRHPQEHDSK